MNRIPLVILLLISVGCHRECPLEDSPDVSDILPSMLTYALFETHELGDFEYTEKPVQVIIKDHYFTQIDSDGNHSEKDTKEFRDTDIPTSVGNYRLQLMSDEQLLDHVQKEGQFSYLQIGINVVDPCTVLFYAENSFMLPPENKFGILAGGGFICWFHYSDGEWITEGPVTAYNS